MKKIPFILGRMRYFINFVAFGVFVTQFLSFAFSVLNLKEPEDEWGELYTFFIITAYLCSLLSIVLFALLYNFRNRYKNRVLNCIFLVITILGGYVHILQIFKINDFIISSCILLLFDGYNVYRILSIIFFNTNRSEDSVNEPYYYNR